jgi:hypothetical protein
MLETEIILKEETKKEIASTIEWSKYAAYISIFGIAIGLLQIIVGLIKGNASIFASLISFLISSAISLVMSINLLNYSKLMESGLNNHSSSDLSQALHHLKTYFTIMGVLFIIAISLVLLGLIISIIAFAIS